MPGESVVSELTTKGFELLLHLAESHPVTASQGEGVARPLSGSGNGATPVLGVGLMGPDQLMPPTTLIELALIIAPPLPTMAAVGLLESTYMPQFAVKLVLPFWE